MPVPFLSSATGDSINTRRFCAIQTTQGVPPAEADYVEFLSNGGEFGIAAQSVTPHLLSTSAEQLPDLVGKITIDPATLALGDADPENKVLMRAASNLFRFYTHTSIGGSRERWEYFLAGVTAGAPFLAFLNDNDVLPRQRFIDCLVNSLEIAATAGSNLDVNIGLIPGIFDSLGLVTQTTGTGSTIPTFTAYLHDQTFALDAVDQDVYVQWVDFAAKTYKAKVTAAASYGSQVYTFVNDVPARVWDESGNPVGSFASQLMFTVPTGATGTNADVFKVSKRRAAFAAPSLATRRSIASVSTAFIVNGVETRIEGGWKFGVGAPDIQRLEDPSGRQSGRSFRRGLLVPYIEINREIINLDLQKAIIGAESLAIVLQAETATHIASTNKPFRVMFIMPSAIPEPGTTLFDTAVGGQGRSESIKFTVRAPGSAYSFTPLGDDAAISTTNAVKFILENDQTAT